MLLSSKEEHQRLLMTTRRKSKEQFTVVRMEKQTDTGIYKGPFSQGDGHFARGDTGYPDPTDDGIEVKTWSMMFGCKNLVDLQRWFGWIGMCELIHNGYSMAVYTIESYIAGKTQVAFHPHDVVKVKRIKSIDELRKLLWESEEIYYGEDHPKSKRARRKLDRLLETQ